MKTKIWENQNNLVFEGDISKDEAIERAIAHHLKTPDRYHEIYRYEEYFGRYIGVAQWESGDCLHQRPKEKCPQCLSSEVNPE